MTPDDPLPHFGSGIVLRRLGPADLAAFQAYRSDRELGRYQGWSAMSDERARAFLAEMHAVALFTPGEWVQLAIVAAGEGTLIGDIGLCLSSDSREAEIGVTLARPAQGRGLATAAVREGLRLIFRLTPAERVLGITDARNLASIRVLERAGLRKLGERAALFRGEPCAECVFAVRRADL
ncbi:MAG: GNAT family N-acetyltransferase [Vicinamibacterales bacterium]|jgi:RimJ/RimL family protein N-acetyltransferase|nr:GNAT family N-acetyltransferase [Vicinamibacterales bacterium]